MIVVLVDFLLHSTELSRSGATSTDEQFSVIKKYNEVGSVVFTLLEGIQMVLLFTETECREYIFFNYSELT